MHEAHLRCLLPNEIKAHNVLTRRRRKRKRWEKLWVEYEKILNNDLAGCFGLTLSHPHIVLSHRELEY